MGYIVRMPQMGYEMEEGQVVAWECDEGDDVAEDETIVVIESEKATNEVESREGGTLRRIVVPEGGTVEPGTPIGVVAGADEDISGYEAEIDAGSPTGTAGATAGSTDGQRAVRASPGARELAGEEGVDLAAVEGTGPQGVVTEEDVANYAMETAATDPAGDDQAIEIVEEPIDAAPPAGVRASPGARQLAGRTGVDMTALEGTGPHGVVTEADVRRRVEEAAAAEPAAGGGAGATRTVSGAHELSRVQQTISDRLSESYRNAVHVTVKRRFDASALTAVADAAAAAGTDVSLTDLLVKAAGAELATRPAFNALFEDGTHKLVEEVNVGVAVDIDEGLLTPVVPSVTDKSAEEVAAVRGELTERAFDGEYATDDLAGGTFTVSNLGPFGVDSFDPVINPPEVAILGVGRVREDDTMTLSLSFDHRVHNGADAARFLDGLVDTLTDPLALAALFETDPLDFPRVDVSVAVDPGA
jgi:pyruvate dehydrogenase E2 component (dihydrolipoamide acetyltransferase)